MDEKLIELVRNFPELYDLSHKKYMDTGFKNKIWSDIGRELKLEGSACKARWNNIRDNYRKSIKKNVTKSGQSSQKVKHYKFAQQLEFLRIFFNERSTRGNIESQEEVETAEQEDSGEDVNEEENTVHTEDLPYIGEYTEGESVVTRSLQKPIQQTPKKLKAPQQSASSHLMEYLITKNSKQHAASTMTNTHPVDAFLAGIAPTLKTLSPYYLNLARSEIFSTVQKYELLMITKHYSLQNAQQSGSFGGQYTNLSSPCDITQHSNTSTRTSTPITSPTDPVNDV